MNDFWPKQLVGSRCASDSAREDLDAGDAESFPDLQDLLTGEPSACWQQERPDCWDDGRAQKLSHESHFRARRCAPLEDFDALAVGLLGDEVALSFAPPSLRHDEATRPEAAAVIGVRVLVGGNHDDTMDAPGVSEGGFHCARKKFPSAALSCDASDADLPAKASEWEKGAQEGFASKAGSKC
jgi:hypothetical protein